MKEEEEVEERRSASCTIIDRDVIPAISCAPQRAHLACARILRTDLLGGMFLRLEQLGGKRRTARLLHLHLALGLRHGLAERFVLRGELGGHGLLRRERALGAAQCSESAKDVFGGASQSVSRIRITCQR